MPKITYIEHDGTEHTVDVPVGWTVMEGAVRNSIPGIDADCAGNCICSTCVVHVDSAWADRLPPREGNEEAMLDFAVEVQPTSRLACQVRVTDDIDGLIVRMPKSQRLNL